MRILIIGGDAAGMSAASQIKRRHPNWHVEAFEMGKYTSYALCGVPYYIGDVIKNFNNLIAITPEEFKEKRNITINMEHKVIKINRNDKNIEVLDLKTSKKRIEKYDKLVIATGAEPISLPEVNTDNLENVFYLHNLDDAKKLKEKTKKAKSAVVIGAGYIGLEIVEALQGIGLETTLIGRRPAPIFETELQDLVSEELSKNKVHFLQNVDAINILQEKDNSLLIKTNKNIDVKTDLVVIGIGVKPRTDLAKEAGLELGIKNAIKVNEFQQSSDPDIYAAGDCAESYHNISKKSMHIALALGANRQGKIAGLHISGLDEKFPGILGTSILKTFALALARTGLGLQEALDNGFQNAVKTKILQNSKPGYYPGASKITVLIIHDSKTKKLLGAQMAGSVEGVGARINAFATALAANLTLKEISKIDMAYAPPFSPVFDPVIIACEVANKE